MKNLLTKRIIKLVAFVMLMIQLIAISASAKGNVLSIYRNQPEVSTPFNVINMFPGDYETKVYTIKVSYKGSIEVYFAADVRAGYEKLAEVLKCRVVINDNSTALYDGLMKEMPDLKHSISAVNKTEDLQYKISVYLDTSVGNEYKNKELVVDFKWWAYTADEGRPGGGGTIKPVIIPGGGNKPITPPDDDKPITQPDDKDEPIVSPPDEDEPSDFPSDNPQFPEDEGITSEDVQRPDGELTYPPKTGDTANPVLWIILICFSLFVILLYISFKKKREPKQEKNPIVKKLTICIVIIVILAICLCVTTFALVYSIVSVDENIFKTGTVEINLNDGKPIITEDDKFLFEPGMTVAKDFFIKNESSDEVYYKIYFDNVHGGLEKVLNVKILDKETGNKLYDGKAVGLIRENCESAELLLNETRTLTAEFHYPEISGNDTQNLSMAFNMCAVATQKKNNDGGEFD